MMYLSNAEVHLWQIDLRHEGVEDVLSPEERVRAARLKIPVVRARFISAHTALRRILAKYTAEPLNFVYNQHGKPALINSSLHFNLAHSEDLALLALARNSIGVDLEHIRPIKEAAYIASTAFTESERRSLLEFPTNQQEKAFFRLWTCKEAAMKALGAGFRLAQDIEITFDKSPRLTRLADENTSLWSLAIVPDLPNVAAALVIKQQRAVLRIYNHPT